MKDTIIGVDLAKNVFQLHAAFMTGELKFRKKLSSGQFSRLVSEQADAGHATERTFRAQLILAGDHSRDGRGPCTSPSPNFQTKRLQAPGQRHCDSVWTGGRLGQ